MYKKYILRCSALVLALLLTVQTGVLPVWASEEPETAETETALLQEETEEVFPEEETEEVLPEEETEEVFPEEETEASAVEEDVTEDDMSVDVVDGSEKDAAEVGVRASAEDAAAAERLKEELSKNGNPVTQYVNDEDHRIKTTVWAKGITPPEMSAFIKEEDEVQGAKYVTYRTPYEENKGWYDVNKTIGRPLDSKLCYAAAASNALHWWLEQNGSYIDRYLNEYPDDPKKQDLRTLRNSFVSQADSEIYKRYILQFSSRQEGFWSDLLVDQFVNGYVPNENGATNHSEAVKEKLVQNGPSDKGGFLYDIFGTTLLTDRMSGGDFRTFGNDLKTNFMNGNLVLIDYKASAINHVVTIWGAEYDVDGQISAVYLTDSDDEDKASSQGMVRYMVKNLNGMPIFSTNINGMSGSTIGYIQTVSLGQQIWEKRLNADPNAPKIPLALEWGNTEFTYNGSAHLPYVRAVQNIEGEDDVLVFVEGAQTDAGVHTANVVIKGASAGRYELPDGGKKEFVIQKAVPKVKLTAKLSQDKKVVNIEIRVTGTNNERPTGTVTIKNGQDVIADQVLLTNGEAVYTWTNLPLGNHSITAEFKPAADGVGKNYEKANSNSAWIDLPKKEQNALSLIPVGDKKYGDGDFLLATTGGSGKGAVTYSCSADGVLSISGDTAVIVGAGTTTVTAVKAGDDTYNSTSATYTITVAKADAPQITYPSAGSLVYGQKLAQSVLSGGSTEYGNFVWDNGEQIPEAGDSSYTVRFIPDSDTLQNYETITQVTKAVTVAVGKADSAIALKVEVKSDGKQAELSASVGKVPQGAGVTGTVTFVAVKDDGSVLTEIARAVPIINGTATYVWSGMPPQSYQVQARYGGDKNYKAVASQTVQVDLGSVGKPKFIILLYENTLGRYPSQGEIDYWERELSNGRTGADTAYGFLFSEEFQNKNYGNSEYVEHLYLSLMGRSSDSAGMAYWVKRLEDGMSRNYVFGQFINSREFGNLCSTYGIERGAATLTEERDKNYDVTRFVARNYTQFLGRNYDAEGLNYWTEFINNRTKSMQDVAFGFVFSPECENKNLSDYEFVAMLYRGCFDREGDRAGIDYWVEKLRSGEKDRMGVFYGFANSQEFADMVKSYGL